MIQTSTAWACVNRFGGVANDTIRAYRKDSIRAFTDDVNKPWGWWRTHHGWTCRRVIIGDPAVLIECREAHTPADGEES